MRFVFLGEPLSAVGNELHRVGATWEIVPGLAELSSSAVQTISQLLQSTGPALTHFHYCSGVSLLFPRLAAAGHLSVFTYHMSGEAVRSAGVKGQVKRFRRAATTSFLNSFTAVSDWARRKLAADYHLPEERISVIYNGVEIGGKPGSTAIDATAPRLMVVAALIREKGIDTAIRALALVRRSRSQATLTIVGVGPEQTALEQLAAAEGVADSVSWLGLRDDVPRLMAEHDVVLVPSRWGEAFGLTLAEGLAAGRPVIASRIGGIPELITDGVNGLLVAPDDAEAWAASIIRVLDDSALTTLLGEAAYATAVRRFSVRDNVGRYWELYRELDPWTFVEVERGHHDC